jgi:outer membrane lipoprotein-sorting protein
MINGCEQQASVGVVAEPEMDSLTAKELIDRMGKVYADCNSYRDTGVVTTVFIEAGSEWTEKKPFQTGFVRPNRFRFEYTDEKRNGAEYRYIVWRKGDEVQTWWDVSPGIEKPESLGLALAGATGVSGGSAHTIPELLLGEEVGGISLTAITKIKRIEDAEFDNVDCFRVTGVFVDNPERIWIDKETFLIRRIDTQVEFDDFRTDETTTYDPAINEEIADSKLAFDPPDHI